MTAEFFCGDPKDLTKEITDTDIEPVNNDTQKLVDEEYLPFGEPLPEWDQEEN